MFSNGSDSCLSISFAKLTVVFIYLFLFNTVTREVGIKISDLKVTDPANLKKLSSCKWLQGLLITVLRIRNPVPFLSLDPGSGMGEKSVSGSGMNNPDHISESFKIIF